MTTQHHHNLLIIAGTGRNSGKTALACRIIERFTHLKPVAVKISPHFHKPGPGLLEYYIGKDYGIYSETEIMGNKDSSRMLRSGASAVYYIQATDSSVIQAFNTILPEISDKLPVICESSSLGKYIIPGVLFIADNDNIRNKKDISGLLSDNRHVFYPCADDHDISLLSFSGSRWFFG